MLHPLSISPFLFCFPRPFLSLWFHPTFPPAVTPSQSPLVFHSSFYNPPLSAFVIRAVTEQCLQGLPRGLPMWHICFTTTHLTLQPLSLLCSDYRGRDRKHSPYKLFTPTLCIPAPPPSSSPTPCCTLQAPADRQEAVLSFCSNGASSLRASWLHSRAWLDHQTGT